MAREYWIRQGDFDAQGPFTLEKVQAYIASGRVRADMWLSTDGEDWHRGSAFPELFPITAARPATRAVKGRRHQAPIARATRRLHQRWMWVGSMSFLAVMVVAVVLVLGRGSTDEPKDDQPDPRTPAGIYARSQNAVALLADGFSVGTGFVAAPGILVTNAHVTRSMFIEEIKVYFDADSDEGEDVLELLLDDTARDICLLRLQDERKPLPMRTGTAPPRGTEVVVIGNPGVGTQVLEKVITEGLVGPTVDLDGMEFLQISASVNPGNSGGPVLDMEGLVLAMTTMKSRDLEGVAFGVPAADIAAAIDRVELRRDSDDEPRGLVHDAIAAFWRLAGAGATHLQIASVCLEKADEQIAAGRSPRVAINTIRILAEEAVKGARIDLTAVDERLKLLSKNVVLPAHLRAQLMQFRNAVREIERMNMKPPTDLDAYRKQLHRLHGEANPLREKLAEELKALQGK